MYRTNYLQRQKVETLAKIRKWIEEEGGIEKMDKEQLIRKMEIIIGCSHSKGEEYLRTLIGE